MAANGEIFRVVLSYGAPGASIAQTVHWYEFLGPGLPDATVNTEFVQWATSTWGAAWAPIASNQAELNQVDIDVINTDGTVARNSGSQTIAVSGTSPGNVLPGANAAFMIANTPLPKQKGKKYAPFLDEDSVASGFLESAALTLLSDLFDAYVLTLTPVIGSDLFPGILSRTLLQFVQFPGGGKVTNVPAYQRRRKPNVGI